MSGFVVERKAGWDCHGLPVEMGVQKELDLHSYTEVEAFGLSQFNDKCENSVWKCDISRVWKCLKRETMLEMLYKPRLEMLKT